MTRARPRYVRRRKFDRLEHSTRFLKWLDEQATRIGIAAERVFEDLLVRDHMTFEQVEAYVVPDSVPEITSVNIVGAPTVGVVLTLEVVVTGKPVPVLTYQWTKAGVNIGGATAATYTCVTGDIGSMIAVNVLATNSEGTDTGTDSIGPVVAA